MSVIATKVQSYKYGVELTLEETSIGQETLFIGFDAIGVMTVRHPTSTQNKKTSTLSMTVEGEAGTFEVKNSAEVDYCYKMYRDFKALQYRQLE